MTSDISIGIEIEINRLNQNLRDIAQRSGLWNTDSEHCGAELRSKPCRGSGQIREILKTIREFSAVAGSKNGRPSCGFNNAGTHIHIDFIPPSNKKNPRKESDLKKIDTSKPRVYKCKHCTGKTHEEPRESPFGTRYYWVGPGKKKWKSPSQYIRAWKPVRPNPSKVYRDASKGKILKSVQRFLIIAKRFCPLFFAIQKPERRFNKYCHTLEYWREEDIWKAKSIQQICESPKLLNGHRRHAVNPLAFQKYGTIEIRMLAADFKVEQIWAQTFMFCKLAKLAKSDREIPEPSGDVAADFVNLMNAASVHGKIRRTLMKMIVDHKATTVPTRCFSCQTNGQSNYYYDYGLSRPICHDCHDAYVWCCFCGSRMYRNKENRRDMEVIDKAGIDIRMACGYCLTQKKDRLSWEKKMGGIHLMGTFVPNGLDKRNRVIQRFLKG